MYIQWWPSSKQCDVTVRRVEKWIAKKDKEFSKARWLSYTKVNQEYVATVHVC